jgi:hypothetical protein
VKNYFLKKYKRLCQDLYEFKKNSSIPNVEEKIMEVAKDIVMFLREK